jgi:hypothetical protein
MRLNTEQIGNADVSTKGGWDGTGTSRSQLMFNLVLRKEIFIKIPFVVSPSADCLVMPVWSGVELKVYDVFDTSGVNNVISRLEILFPSVFNAGFI